MKKSPDWTNTSKTIASLRLPLIILVIVIHASLTHLLSGASAPDGGTAYQCYMALETFFGRILPRPNRFFFFFSGFLFFFKLTSYDRVTYKSKLQNRVRTLLIPYIFWNLVVLLAYVLLEMLAPGMYSETKKMMSDYSLTDWLWTFWNTQMIDPQSWAMPINNPLWFIRDLLVLVVASPVIWWLTKKCNYFFPIILSLLWIFDFWYDIPGFSISPILFFSLGAYLGIRKIDFMSFIDKYIGIISTTYLLLTILDLSGLICQPYRDILHRVGDFTGMCTILGMTSKILDSALMRTSRKLAESSFFVYVYHILPLFLSIKIALRVINPTTDFAACALYISLPVIIIILGIVAHKLMKMLMPRFTAIITGGRTQ